MTTAHHPTDEDLILHFYGERDAAEGGRLDAHLEACPSCRAAWVELAETMQLVDRAAAPEPGPGFERVAWARVRAALPARRRGWTWRVALPLAATAVVSATAGGVAWHLLRHRAPAAPSRTAAEAPARPASAARPAPLGERVLLTALDDHFQQAQMLLVELKNAPDDTSDLEFERASADELVAASRLYGIAARQQGERQFAQTLDELEAVLVDLARSRDAVDPDELRALRARIDSQDLLFKVRAATKQVHEQQKNLLTAAAHE